MQNRARSLTLPERREAYAHPALSGLRRSFTIIELLVVIGLITILLGIGVGVYYGFVRMNAMQAETGAVTAVIRSARSTAVAEGSETFVCVDTAKNQLYPFGRSKVGVWHFETLDGSRSDGAFGHVALADGGAAALADGKVGKAVSFDGTLRFRCKMYRAGNLVNIPTYDARQGVAVEAWVMPAEAGSGPLAVLSRDGWFAMELLYDAAESRFALSAYAVTVGADGAGCVKRSASTAAAIRPNEWTHVSMSCHKLSPGVTLRINGVEQVAAGSASEPSAAPDAGADTIIGGTALGTGGFRGRIDGLILSAFAVDTVHTVTPKLKLRAEGLASGNTIRFDASGRLTAAHDGVAPKIVLEDYAGPTLTSSVTVTVGSMGALDVAAWNR